MLIVDIPVETVTNTALLHSKVRARSISGNEIVWCFETSPVICRSEGGTSSLIAAAVRRQSSRGVIIAFAHSFSERDSDRVLFVAVREHLKPIPKCPNATLFYQQPKMCPTKLQASSPLLHTPKK